MKKLLVLFSVFLLVSCNSAKKNEYQKPLGGIPYSNDERKFKESGLRSKK